MNCVKCNRGWWRWETAEINAEPIQAVAQVGETMKRPTKTKIRFIFSSRRIPIKLLKSPILWIHRKSNYFNMDWRIFSQSKPMQLRWIPVHIWSSAPNEMKINHKNCTTNSNRFSFLKNNYSLNGLMEATWTGELKVLFHANCLIYYLIIVTLSKCFHSFCVYHEVNENYFLLIPYSI